MRIMVSFAYAEPDNGGEPIDLDVYHYNGAGGVALCMYNTDEVCFDFRLISQTLDVLIRVHPNVRYDAWKYDRTACSFFIFSSMA